MGFIEDLLKTKNGRKVFEKERVLYEVTELIALAMEKEGLSKADLARRLGTQKSYITQLLNGKENMTLAKVSDVLFELKQRFFVRAEPIENMEEVSDSIHTWLDSATESADYWGKFEVETNEFPVVFGQISSQAA